MSHGREFARGVAHFFNQKHEPPTPGTASTDRTSEPTCGAWRPRVFMLRSAANADRARTTCSGARSRARKVLSPSSQPRPRRLPAGRRHLVAGVVIATVVPPGTCRPPRDPAADDGTAKEQEPSTSERNGSRAPVPAVVRCSSPLEAVRLPSSSPRAVGARAARESGLQHHRRASYFS